MQPDATKTETKPKKTKLKTLKDTTLISGNRNMRKKLLMTRKPNPKNLKNITDWLNCAIKSETARLTKQIFRKKQKHL